MRSIDGNRFPTWEGRIARNLLSRKQGGGIVRDMNDVAFVLTTTTTTGAEISIMGISIMKRCLPVVEVSESR